MKEITIPEYGKICPDNLKPSKSGFQDGNVYLGKHLFERLSRYEQKFARNGQTVFICYRDYIQAQQWVGVIQIPGLQVEILPKIEAATAEADAAKDKSGAGLPRGNLLYMLSFAGDLPIRHRDVARIATSNAPLGDILISLFASALREELLRGHERHYRSYEENLRYFKGKMRVGDHIIRNAAHRERFYCRYDEFTPDTDLNRIFKAACRILLTVAQRLPTQDALRHCLLLLDDVRDIVIGPDQLERIVFHRQNERFRDLFEFCRLIFSQQAPSGHSGGAPCFSLLFDMNKVFERFIAEFLRRRVIPGNPGCTIDLQARRDRRHLFQDSTDNTKQILKLKPDILIKHRDDENLERNLVIDTKWKKLTMSAGGAVHAGIDDGDLYQCHAYANRYGCRHSILLYPSVHRKMDDSDKQSKLPTYNILNEADEPTCSSVCIRFVDVGKDFQKDRLKSEAELTDELKALVCAGVGF